MVRIGGLAREGDLAADDHAHGIVHSGEFGDLSPYKPTEPLNPLNPLNPSTPSVLQVLKLNRSKTREQRAGEINEDQ